MIPDLVFTRIPDSEARTMDRDAFRSLVSELTAQIDGRPLDGGLADLLNSKHAPGSALHERITTACSAAIEAGWMCDRDASGIRFGRAAQPSPETHGFSVDVVDMSDCAGPHHTHPEGEIDLIMPVEGTPQFDGQGAGWKVYGPGSAHAPTVRGGRARILYLLPGGAILFTGRRAIGR